MSEDVDYEPDVLQFKQVWGGETRLPNDNHAKNKNLQTIESATKEAKRKSVKSQKKGGQAQQLTKTKPKQSSKKGQQATKQFCRNPKQGQEVIQVSTQPQKFYQTPFENEKNNIAKSHLYFDHKPPMPNIDTNNISLTHGSNGWLFQMKHLLQQKDHQLSMYRIANSRSEDRIRLLQKQLSEKDAVIGQLRQRQRRMIEKNCDLQSKEVNFDYGRAEYENFKNDSRRLLRMLQATAEYREFANFAIDDNGVRFLANVNKDKKSKLDTSPSNYVQTLHYCTCNKQFIPQSGFWVPEKVYNFGKQFVKSRKGELTEPELQLLLYELNKIWRERQKRIVNMYEGVKAHEVGKLKRMVKNLQGKTGGRTKSMRKSEQRSIQNNQQ